MNGRASTRACACNDNGMAKRAEPLLSYHFRKTKGSGGGNSFSSCIIVGLHSYCVSGVYYLDLDRESL